VPEEVFIENHFATIMFVIYFLLSNPCIFARELNTLNKVTLDASSYLYYLQ